MTDFHPIASMFPLMEGAEFEALVADIAEHGQREPIVLHVGMVLDGRNRWRACERLGLRPKTKAYDNGGDPEAFVISLNLHRRHLTREQRDALIQQKRTQGWTLQKIADAVGVSYGTAHNVAGDLIINSDIENERGQMRPAQYARRTQEPSIDDGMEDERGCWNCKHCHDDRGRGGWFCVALGYSFMETIPCDMQYWEADMAAEPEPESGLPSNGDRPHVTYNSGNNEWYTPPEYIGAALAVMGGIDLDPASSEIANRLVGARTFYTQGDDGLSHDWQGRVWMNPPYASEWIGRFCEKLAAHVKQGDVTEACVLVNNATETGWFNALLDVAAAVCFIRGRVRFLDTDGNPSGAPLQGQALLYIGPQARRFGAICRDFGTVLYAG